MKVNGEAIYGTRPIAPYKEAKTCFTSLPDGTVYAIYLADEDETAPPAKIMLTSIAPAAGTAVRMLGVREAVRWEKVGKGALLTFPPSAVAKPPCRYAWVFKFKAARAGQGRRVMTAPGPRVLLALVAAATAVPAGAEWLRGYGRTVSGMTLSYHSPYPDITSALIVRASDGTSSVEWETEAVPAGWARPAGDLRLAGRAGHGQGRAPLSSSPSTARPS